MYTHSKAYSMPILQRSNNFRAVLCWLVVALVVVCTPALAKPKPITAKSQLEFGIDMAERGLWSEALFRFQQAERLGGRSTAVYNNMAVAYEALGVFEKAREFYLRAIDSSPTSPDLKRNYSRFVEFYQSFKPEGEDDSETAESDGAEPSEESADPASSS